MAKKFQKKVEDFVCEHCGTAVKGTGYTNHCPECLWSKHVDINPGDRAADCGGMMEPVLVENKRSNYVVTQKCQKCGFERSNRLNSNENFEAAAATAARYAQKTIGGGK